MLDLFITVLPAEIGLPRDMKKELNYSVSQQKMKISFYFYRDSQNETSDFCFFFVANLISRHFASKVLES